MVSADDARKFKSKVTRKYGNYYGSMVAPFLSSSLVEAYAYLLVLREPPYFDFLTHFIIVILSLYKSPIEYECNYF